MKNIKRNALRDLVTGTALVLGTTIALAADDYSRLGKDLTPLGAERAGNKDGTIPAWDGGVKKAPASFDPKKGYANAFPDDKPLYTITAANYKQYESKLMPGQIELLKRYPSYKIVVYPTRRSHALPQEQYDTIAKEGPNIKLIPSGNGLTGRRKTTVPFPFAQSAGEIYQNMLMRFRGYAYNRTVATFPVQANGSFTPTVRRENIMWSIGLADPAPNLMYYFLGATVAPASVAGEITLFHEPIDQSKESRKVWAYNPGSRRVLRAPEVAFDTPLPGSDGSATMDDNDGLNGSPERYNLKLLGKKEMIIGYNNFALTNKDLKYKNIAGKQTVNQDLVRYELHRVYHVEATLKPGARHIYAKRVILFDEDSYQVAHVDNYDGRGQLWRVHELLASFYYDCPCTWIAADTQYDLQSGRYMITALTNEEKPQDFLVKFKADYFSPDNIKRAAQ